MTEPTPAPRRIVLTLAVFAIVAFAACVICAFGFIALLSGGTVIDESDAGPLVGPVMVAAATVVLFIALIIIGARLDADSLTIPLGSAVLAAVGIGFAYLLSGALAYSATTGDPIDAVLFFGRQLSTPYTLSVTTLAFVIVLLDLLVLLSQLHGGRRPRWPWERGEQ